MDELVEDSPEISTEDEVLYSEPVSNSEILRVEGFVEVLDIADDIEDMFLNGLKSGVSTGWHTLDGIYTVARKQWTVITGSPGTGKSLFVDNLQVNLSEQWGWKHLNFSAETQPVHLHVKSLADIHLNKRFDKRNCTSEEYCHTLAFVQDHWRFADLEETEWTMDGLLEKADAIRENGYNFDTLLIDPWNELEHRRPSAMTEIEYVSYVLTKFRRHARKHDYHGFIVAHPRKPQTVSVKHTDTADIEKMTKQMFVVPTLNDISGPGCWYSKCDMGIVLWRDLNTKSSPTKVIVEKVKFRHCGKTGEGNLWYDIVSSKFFDRVSDCRLPGEA